MLADPEMKNVFTNFIASVAVFMAPAYGFVIVIGVCIFATIFTSIWKTIKFREWSIYRKDVLSILIGKMLIYSVVILCMYIIDRLLLNELLMMWISVPLLVTKITCVILLIAEGAIIKSNVEKIFAMDLWKLIRKALRGVREISSDARDIREDIGCAPQRNSPGIDEEPNDRI